MSLSIYTVYIEDKRTSNGGFTSPQGAVLGSSCGRYLTIVTDSLNNAIAIGRARCTPNEEVTSASRGNDDVIVDHAVAKETN